MEENSKKILLAPHEWQEIRLQLPNATLIRENGIRINPLNTQGVAYISKDGFELIPEAEIKQKMDGLKK